MSGRSPISFLHGFRDFPHQMRVVAQQAIVTFVGAAGVHFHQSGSGFRNQMRGGDMVGDVRLAVHAVHAGTLGSWARAAARRRGGDRLLHVRLPFVGVTRRHAETCWRSKSEAHIGCRQARLHPVRRCREPATRLRSSDARRARSGRRCNPTRGSGPSCTPPNRNPCGRRRW